ncbi:(4Fe-4S)-binding protein [Pseudosporangium ferrugineum]|uniref:Ferredoxin n=1 Tax=Pseudosporangium ferrugineum TaxID=439699 RepID=A0A2T0RXD4_9ACTN|nr:(4Fe-4S)-binding protein [Pseudosporangium ferrugineum]PRY25844.1 ferredoxin [Pseudosporangium ferrugineum]
MRITADTGVCVGAGQCVLTDPGVFDQDADGIVTLLTDRPDAAAAEGVRTAVELCPAGALSIVEDEAAPA